MSLSTYRLTPSIAVSDMARAQQFYEGQLGLAAVQAGADGSRVYAAGRHVAACLPVSDPRGHVGRRLPPGMWTMSSWWSTSSAPGVSRSSTMRANDRRAGDITESRRRQGRVVQRPRRKHVRDRGESLAT